MVIVTQGQYCDKYMIVIQFTYVGNYQLPLKVIKVLQEVNQ